MLEKGLVNNGDTLQEALLSAADSKDLRRSERVVQLLLEAGADANAGKDHFDAWASPLGKAVYHENFKAVQLLLQHGANVQVTASYQASALEYAASYNKGSEMVHLLIKHGALQGQEAAIKKAALEGKWDTLQILMDSFH
jgi:ankyrin repeat protein